MIRKSIVQDLNRNINGKLKKICKDAYFFMDYYAKNHISWRVMICSVLSGIVNFFEFNEEDFDLEGKRKIWAEINSNYSKYCGKMISIHVSYGLDGVAYACTKGF